MGNIESAPNPSDKQEAVAMWARKDWPVPWTRHGSGVNEWWSHDGYEARKHPGGHWALIRDGKTLFTHEYLQEVIAYAAPLANPSDKGAEPVAWLVDPGIGSAIDKFQRTAPSEQQLKDIEDRCGSVTPLYAAPRPAAHDDVRDAERYRWLCGKHGLGKENLDGQIDAAIAKEQQE